jgi:putative FmdB family regulatory protein
MFSKLVEEFMPTYEYKCKKCGSTFEKFQSITEKPITHCQFCNGSVYRLISKNVSFILKGSGFYSTDNPKTNRKIEKKKITSQSKKEKVKENLPKKAESNNNKKKSLQTSVK